MLAAKVYDALVVGGGPAGLSAALALARVSRTALVFDTNEFRSAGAQAMHTVLSRDGTNPAEFRKIARHQLETDYTTVDFNDKAAIEVEKITLEPGHAGFQVRDAADAIFQGRKLVLATGSEDVLPVDLPGYKENWPRNIYQCLFCDGLERAGKPVGILTFPIAMYLHFAVMAKHFGGPVTIFTNGVKERAEDVDAALQKALKLGITIEERPIRELIGEEGGVTVHFQDGSQQEVAYLVHKPPTKNRGQALIDQLGLEVMQPSGEVVTKPPFGESSVPGCFVAGDTAGFLKQVAIAMGEGVRAGSGVSFQLCSETVASLD
ncbi:hypothetical protein BDZ85DRAFT_276447 [Elsinoe ampelina]|uniref:FAD/NAD(P)-binding domain-containing protein n=1 Tax=Elsinoe ampelina TaxID=302913 RepID=A0A6A6G0E5_9PEZI|nr:hypothetical protein BDZ85DRAFT_276447 [Elsinoe ampelina]